MFYLAIVSSSFRKSSIDELASVSDFSIADEFVTTLVIESREGFSEELLRRNPIFVYNILPLKGRHDIGADYLGSLYSALTSEVGKEGSIKAECFDVNCKTDYSAKDIEVYLGQRMERDGYEVDIVNPDRLAYLVLINGRCYVGIADYASMGKKFVNPERHYHEFSGEAVSRSELKLMQAFDEFGIRKGGMAIDLGASPGGWSDFLSRSGFRVVAIDGGALDYAVLKEKGIPVKIAEEGRAIFAGDIPENGILHIKANSAKAALDPSFKADLLVNDMNVAPAESAGIVLGFAGNMAPGASLVMTVKCIDRKAEKHIAKARKALEKDFDIKGIRVLPSNRQELTLYAILVRQEAHND